MAAKSSQCNNTLGHMPGGGMSLMGTKEMMECFEVSLW